MTRFLKKVQKPCFSASFDHFWSFLPNGDFFKKSGSVTHNYIWAPNTNLSLQKKTNKPILRKLTDRCKDGWKDGRKDGRTDGLALFYRTLRPGVQNNCFTNIVVRQKECPVIITVAKHQRRVSDISPLFWDRNWVSVTGGWHFNNAQWTWLSLLSHWQNSWWI